MGQTLSTSINCVRAPKKKPSKLGASPTNDLSQSWTFLHQTPQALALNQNGATSEGYCPTPGIAAGTPDVYKEWEQNMFALPRPQLTGTGSSNSSRGTSDESPSNLVVASYHPGGGHVHSDSSGQEELSSRKRHRACNQHSTETTNIKNHQKTRHDRKEPVHAASAHQQHQTTASSYLAPPAEHTLESRGDSDHHATCCQVCCDCETHKCQSVHRHDNPPPTTGLLAALSLNTSDNNLTAEEQAINSLIWRTPNNHPHLNCPHLPLNGNIQDFGNVHPLYDQGLLQPKQRSSYTFAPQNSIYKLGSYHNSFINTPIHPAFSSNIYPACFFPTQAEQTNISFVRPQSGQHCSGHPHKERQRPLVSCIDTPVHYQSSALCRPQLRLPDPPPVSIPAGNGVTHHPPNPYPRSALDALPSVSSARQASMQHVRQWLLQQPDTLVSGGAVEAASSLTPVVPSRPTHTEHDKADELPESRQGTPIMGIKSRQASQKRQRQAKAAHAPNQKADHMGVDNSLNRLRLRKARAKNKCAIKETVLARLAQHLSDHEYDEVNVESLSELDASLPRQNGDVKATLLNNEEQAHASNHCPEAVPTESNHFRRNSSPVENPVYEKISGTETPPKESCKTKKPCSTSIFIKETHKSTSSQHLLRSKLERVKRGKAFKDNLGVDASIEDLLQSASTVGSISPREWLLSSDSHPDDKAPEDQDGPLNIDDDRPDEDVFMEISSVNHEDSGWGIETHVPTEETLFLNFVLGLAYQKYLASTDNPQVASTKGANLDLAAINSVNSENISSSGVPSLSINNENYILNISTSEAEKPTSVETNSSNGTDSLSSPKLLKLDEFELDRPSIGSLQKCLVELPVHANSAHPSGLHQEQLKPADSIPYTSSSNPCQSASDCQSINSNPQEKYLLHPSEPVVPSTPTDHSQPVPASSIVPSDKEDAISKTVPPQHVSPNSCLPMTCHNELACSVAENHIHTDTSLVVGDSEEIWL